jgi:hypothetical protein
MSSLIPFTPRALKLQGQIPRRKPPLRVKPSTATQGTEAPPGKLEDVPPAVDPAMTLLGKLAVDCLLIRDICTELIDNHAALVKARG